MWGIRASRVAPSPEEAVAFRLCAHLSRNVPLAIANSYAGRDFHQGRGYRPRSFAIVPNGVDTDLFKPDARSRASVREEWGVEADQRVIGVVGRLNPVKGHEQFLHSARALIESDSALTFVVVGDGDDVYRERLLGLSRRLGITKHIMWLGERRDMARIYNGLDLLCSAALSEGFPNVAAEAMSCGTPCVVTDVGDSRRIIGQAGIAVPAGDPIALTEGIKRGLEHSETGDSAATRTWIMRNYSMEEMVRGTRDLLERVARGQVPTAQGRCE